MSTVRTCPTCGTPARAEARFCRSCGTALLDTAAGAPTAALEDDTVRAHRPTSPPPPTDPVPLAPTAAGPGVPRPTPPPSTPRTGRSAVVLVVVLAVVAVALGGVIVALLASDGGDADPTAAVAGTVAPDGALDPRSELRPDGAADTDEPVREPKEPPPAASGPPPAGEWIVALRSIDATLPRADIDRAVADVRASVPDARTLISDGFASLRPGYVVVYVGPFPDAASTWDFCHDLGRSECFGAPLTQDPADVEQRILPTDPRPG